MPPRPLWRWWLFCVALDLWHRTEWQWLADLYSWAVLPKWLGADGDFMADDSREPF